MSEDSHLATLKAKHRQLDIHIAQLFNQVSTPDEVIQALKRKKLYLKQQIEQLERTAA